MARFNQFIKKVVYKDITFDSKQEAEYYDMLLDLVEIEQIDSLEVHKSFELIPEYTINGKKVKAMNYEADFVYNDGFIKRAIDVKGFADDVFKLKKKLFDYKYRKEFPYGLEVMKHSKSTGWVNYDDYKKARASYKKRLIEEKNNYKSQLDQIAKDKIRDTKLHERYVYLVDKKNNAKLTPNERKRLEYLENYFKDKFITTPNT